MLARGEDMGVPFPFGDTSLGGRKFTGLLAQADAVEGVHGGHVGEYNLIADF
jgi:hypothetical protein